MMEANLFSRADIGGAMLTDQTFRIFNSFISSIASLSPF